MKRHSIYSYVVRHNVSKLECKQGHNVHHYGTSLMGKHHTTCNHLKHTVNEHTKEFCTLLIYWGILWLPHKMNILLYNIHTFILAMKMYRQDFLNIVAYLLKVQFAKAAMTHRYTMTGKHTKTSLGNKPLLYISSTSNKWQDVICMVHMMQQQRVCWEAVLSFSCR
jgi:hypothetical protein